MTSEQIAIAYYIADLIAAVGFVVIGGVMSRRGRPELLRLLGLGALIGLLWELPIFGLSAWTSMPIIEWTTPLPLPTLVFMVAHSIWDGALLTMGWLLARALTGRASGASGVALQLLWGQATALAVELSAILAGAWFYVDNVGFNPVLFRFRGHAVTLAMQAVWLLAPLGFALLARQVEARAQSSGPSSGG